MSFLKRWRRPRTSVQTVHPTVQIKAKELLEEINKLRTLNGEEPAPYKELRKLLQRILPVSVLLEGVSFSSS